MKTKGFFTHLNVVIIGLCLSSIITYAQNVGIGVPEPTEKLQVDGTIHALANGFRFPDGSLQTRANNSYETQDAGDNCWIIILKGPFMGSFSFDTIVGGVKVIDYQWGLTVIPGGDQGPSVITVHSVHIVKNIDRATNSLLQYALTGQITNGWRLYFYRPAENGMQLYYKFIMNDVNVIGFDQSMVYKGSQDYSQMDAVEIQFESATWIYNDGVNSQTVSWTSQ